MAAALIIVGVLIASACSSSSPSSPSTAERPGGSAPSASVSSDPAEGATSTMPLDPAEAALRLCARASLVEPAPPLVAPSITELSGLAASRSGDDLVWGHNDSGGTATIYAIGLDGSDLGAVELVGAGAFDWEDITIGPGPPAAFDSSRVYVGDIGDNLRQRDVVLVYAVTEPAPSAGSATVIALPLTYPDGPHDAEVLMADPVSGDLFIVTKEWQGGPSVVFRVANADLAAPGFGEGPVEMERVAEIDFEPWGQLTTGGDISPDGSVVAIRTYGQILLWPRLPGTELWEAFDNEPCEAPTAVEGQGESVTFTADGQSYVTIGEGLNAPVNVYLVE